MQLETSFEKAQNETFQFLPRFGNQSLRGECKLKKNASIQKSALRRNGVAEFLKAQKSISLP
jgi:hypothetical protein